MKLRELGLRNFSDRIQQKAFTLALSQAMLLFDVELSLAIMQIKCPGLAFIELFLVKFA